MNKKLLYLTKISLNKKVKTKWFLIANAIFALLIIGLLNMDSIIEFFGGDFNHTTNIYILDESGYGISEPFKTIFNQYEEYIGINSKIANIETEEKGYELVKKDKDNNSILIIVDDDVENYMTAKIISNQSIDSILYQVMTSSLDTIKREYALASHGINNEIMADINASVNVERIKLSNDDSEDSTEFLMGVIFPILTLPVFMLTMFLIQMIGAEINEEKSTKGMEIIISNVSAKTHFLSKLFSGNCFVLLQALLLIIYVALAIYLRFIFTGNFDLTALIGSESMETLNAIGSNNLFSGHLILTILITLVLIILSFVGYSLLAAITASMTTNMEDFQQVQTPIVMISLVGYYLAMMASLFKGSLFIKIFSYIPFISTMLAPALLMLGQITIVDVTISIMVMLLVIYLLIKYGLRIYKVGILNYSSSNIWKKMFQAARNK